MHLSWPMYPVVVAAGFVTGFINTLAGSGSAVSLPLLNMLGLPLDVANGTNRIGILLQNVVAVAGFNRAGKMDWRIGTRLAIPACVGSVLGAILAANMKVRDLSRAIGIVMAIILATLLIKPSRWVETRAEPRAPRPPAVEALILFAMGFYGGFIQIGVGVFLLIALVLTGGLDLVRGNAVKVFIILCISLLALVVFAAKGQVRADIGLLLASGNMLGAWVATREAARRGARFVRGVLIAVVSFATVHYLGLLDLVFR